MANQPAALACPKFDVARVVIPFASGGRAKETQIAGLVAHGSGKLGCMTLHPQLERRRGAGLVRRLCACVQEIDHRTARGLDERVIRSLTWQSVWVGTDENIFVLAPTGVGKSFVARALAQEAYRDGYSASYTRV